MTSTEYLLWLVVMAILIPAIVHGGTTWAYFRGNRKTSTRQTGDTGHASRLRTEARETGPETAGTAAVPPLPTLVAEDDGSVPEKQIWRWNDDGGAAG